MNEEILKSLDAGEKESLQLGLKNLIEQTYIIENEYKILNENYTALRRMVNEIIEVLPVALWILDNKKNIILQNQEALKNKALLEKIKALKNESELEFNAKFYSIKTLTQDGKIIILATDITNEKRTERLASMGSVAAHLAHEIRNPIGSVSLLASTLFMRAEAKNKLIVLEMQKAISRIERIINSTLLFTKGVRINAQNFALKELEEECEQAVNSYNFSARIDFKFDFLDLQICADKALLSLVLQNLIYNAIDAIELGEVKRAKIHIKSEVKDDFLWIKVFDNGLEIEDESAVFEAFKTTKLKGNGLGLCLSKEIISAHNGEIGFKTKPKNFYFCLPFKSKFS